MSGLNKFKIETARDVVLNNQLQIFEIKQITELEDKYRKQCKLALFSYKLWKQQYQMETDVIELLYGQLKGVVLKRNAQNMVQAYWVIRQDFRTVFKNYLNQYSNAQLNLKNKKII